MAVLPAREAKDFGEMSYEFEDLSAVREEEIRSRLDDVKDELDAMPESELLQARKENLELELEVYRYERDNTGAYKFKQFGAEMQKLFTPEEGAPSYMERGKDGSFELTSDMADRRIVFVDMLELDRLNKEGGSHDVGDMGLENASKTIREIAAKFGDYEIYRSGGNQFMLDMKQLDENGYDEMMKALSEVRVSAKEGLDPAPLVANGIDFRTVVEDLNAVQEELGPFGGLEDHEAAREATGIVIRSAEWGSEIRKLTTRADRVREMLETQPDKAGEFFDNYVKKTFQETDYSTLEDFKRLIDEGTFDSAMRELAFDQAHQRFEIDRASDAEDAEAAHQVARKRVVWERAEAHRTEGGRAESQGEGLAEIPEQTFGEQAIAEKVAALDAAQKAYAEDPSPINEEKVTHAKLEVQREKARRDSGTGLLERGVYYEDLEKALAEGEPTAAVFVDMGFLKYFDKQGGRDVGNDALRLAASLMERAVKESGVQGEAYRYGGDEFTILVKGNEQDAKKFLRALEFLNEEAGAVPRGKKSKDDYVPTGLQFSHGIADTSALKELLEATGKETTLNKKAELMTRVADTGVQYLKAADRFDYLMSEMQNPDYQDPKYGEEPGNAFTAQLESKIAYSNKALFSELGGDSVLRAFADELRNLDKLEPGEREAVVQDIEDQLRRFVIERVDTSREKEASNKEKIDRLIEMRTRIGYLEGELDAVREKERKGSKRIKELEAEAERTRKAFKALSDARKAING